MRDRSSDVLRLSSNVESTVAELLLEGLEEDRKERIHLGRDGVGQPIELIVRGQEDVHPWRRHQWTRYPCLPWKRSCIRHRRAVVEQNRLGQLTSADFCSEYATCLVEEDQTSVLVPSGKLEVRQIDAHVHW